MAPFPTITTSSTSIRPGWAADPDAARAMVAAEGAAIASGLADLDAAVAFARELLGERIIRLGPQFEATTTGFLANQAKVAEKGPDDRGRVRSFTPPDEVMTPHNDGYGFGDYAPDHLFLYCSTPDPTGGASWLIDGAGLIAALAEDPATAALADFWWNEPIEHSEPSFIVHPPAPIARRLDSGRVQVRHNPYQISAPGDPLGEQHDAAVALWHDAVHTARDRASRFQLAEGELLCVDNYRCLHGRDAYWLPERKVVSIWGWSLDAVEVPDRPVSIV